ncbi:hypothetical protein D3OALGB2SA_852 [Olavius algarvensis associated proteobacterium Delta 3]|nr:hypothetical protein D3OALGB2SA_852 [Olavius algarvensis associated proteobacterium Delta 3]
MRTANSSQTIFVAVLPHGGVQPGRGRLLPFNRDYGKELSHLPDYGRDPE